MSLILEGLFLFLMLISVTVLRLQSADETAGWRQRYLIVKK